MDHAEFIARDRQTDRQGQRQRETKESACRSCTNYKIYELTCHS